MWADVPLDVVLACAVQAFKLVNAAAARDNRAANLMYFIMTEFTSIPVRITLSLRRAHPWPTPPSRATRIANILCPALHASMIVTGAPAGINSYNSATSAFRIRTHPWLAGSPTRPSWFVPWM